MKWSQLCEPGQVRQTNEDRVFAALHQLTIIRALPKLPFFPSGHPLLLSPGLVAGQLAPDNFSAILVDTRPWR